MVEKMKKSLLWCLVCLVCLIPCSGAALAAEADAAQDAADGYVYDAAGLLTADEISDLNDEIASFMEESGWNVYAVTTDDAQGKVRPPTRMISLMNIPRNRKTVWHC